MYAFLLSAAAAALHCVAFLAALRGGPARILTRNCLFPALFLFPNSPTGLRMGVFALTVCQPRGLARKDSF